MSTTKREHRTDASATSEGEYWRGRMVPVQRHPAVDICTSDPPDDGTYLRAKPLGMDDDGKLVYGGRATGDMPTRPYVYCEHGIPEEQCVGCNGARLDQQARVIRRLGGAVDRLITVADAPDVHCLYAGCPPSRKGLCRVYLDDDAATKCRQCWKTWALKGADDGEATNG